ALCSSSVHSSRTRRSSDLGDTLPVTHDGGPETAALGVHALEQVLDDLLLVAARGAVDPGLVALFELVALVDQQGHVAAVVDHQRSEEHTSELQSRENIVCR